MLSFPSTWNDWFTRKKLPNQNLTFINLFPSTEEPLHCNMIYKKQLDFSYNKRIFSVFLVIVQCCFQALGWILKKLLVYLIMRNVDKALPTNIQYLITNLQKKNWRFWSISTTIYMVRIILVVFVPHSKFGMGYTQIEIFLLHTKDSHGLCRNTSSNPLALISLNNPLNRAPIKRGMILNKIWQIWINKHIKIVPTFRRRSNNIYLMSYTRNLIKGQGIYSFSFATGKVLQIPSLKTMTRKYFILTLKSHHAYHNMQMIFPIYK